MARTKQTARRSVGGPQPSQVTVVRVETVVKTPSVETRVETAGETASGGKRRREGTTGVEGKRVVFVVGGKRGEPIQM